MKVTVAEIHLRLPMLEKGLVEEMAENAEAKHLKKGEYLVKAGQYIRSTYLIFEGSVKVVRDNGNGNEIFLHYLNSGQGCALSMVYTSRAQASQVTVKAIEKTVVLFIPFSCMEKWMMQYKSWFQFVWQNFRERMDEVFETIDNITFHNMEERLMYYLQRQSKHLGTRRLPTTQTEIARELNSSREVIGRLLKKLSNSGNLKLHRNFVELIQL